jgi:hypothetical protein
VRDIKKGSGHREPLPSVLLAAATIGRSSIVLSSGCP